MEGSGLRRLSRMEPGFGCELWDLGWLGCMVMTWKCLAALCCSFSWYCLCDGLQDASFVWLALLINFLASYCIQLMNFLTA